MSILLLLASTVMSQCSILMFGYHKDITVIVVVLISDITVLLLIILHSTYARVLFETYTI